MTTPQPTLEIRRAEDRGATSFGWLESRHSFSFGRYRDPDRMGFRGLRVINDDVIAPGGGFGEHGHDNMEIITWVLKGAVRHADSTGGGGVLNPGELQVMTAGRGIRHSEMNASNSEPVHLLQIWIEPASRDLEPAYAQRAFPIEERRGRWRVVASPDARDGALRINQDATLAIADLDEASEIEAAIPAGRWGYLHLASGSVTADDDALRAGDAITIKGPAALRLKATAPSQALLFDLP